MKKTLRRWLATLLIIQMMILPLVSCSSNDDQTPVANTDNQINQSYIDYLKAQNHTNHPDAQPPTDLFATVKHFDMTPQGTLATSASADAEIYTIYSPASASSSLNKAAIATESGLPGFKPADVIPVECQALADTELADCLENAQDLGADLTPPASHISHFNTDALAVYFGNDFDAAVVEKVFNSLLGNVDIATHTQIAAQLTDYINDAPAHLSLDLAEHNIFDPNGYKLVGATLTDASRGDVDVDGILDPHSTLILQISKTIDYRRSGASELDTALKAYLGAVPDEAYMINLQAFIHLKNLDPLRKTVEPLTDDPNNPPTIEEQLAHSALELEAESINNALDANILKSIIDDPGTISWDSSEFTLSFQIAPDHVSQDLAPLMAAALENGDAAVFQLAEQHMNAQTAIITGTTPSAAGAAAGDNAAEVKVFYQVSRPHVSKAAGGVTSWDYAMLDEYGSRVAILDPQNGALVLAEEQSKFPIPTEDSINVEAAWTKPGACKSDRSNWAYWPSRVRTGNFGRGINWILTEWLLHNQVGDWKNIHWYQSSWKAAAQVAIKGGMWVVKNYLKVEFGGAGLSANTKDYALYYILEVALPTLTTLLSDSSGKNGKKFKIAGYSFEIASGVVRFFREANLYAKNATFGQKASSVIKGAIIGFLIGRASDGVGQSLDVTITGWQDYSHGSHYGCFDFD